MRDMGQGGVGVRRKRKGPCEVCVNCNRLRSRPFSLFGFFDHLESGRVGVMGGA